MGCGEPKTGLTLFTMRGEGRGTGLHVVWSAGLVAVNGRGFLEAFAVFEMWDKDQIELVRSFEKSGEA